MQVNERNPILSILNGILIPGVILCPLYIAFFFFTFNLAGGETIRQTENQNSTFLAMNAALAIVIAFVIRWLWTKREQYKAYGVGVLLLIIFISAIVYYIDNFIPHKSFESAGKTGIDYWLTWASGLRADFEEFDS
jgi:hypothetical protein